MRHFNVSLIVWAKSQDRVYRPQFLKRKESWSGSNRGPSAYQPSALPQGHTGWRVRLERKGNIELYVHRNHQGLLGTGKYGGREFLYLTPILATPSPPEWFWIKVGSCVSHFNVSWIVWAKSQDSVHKPHFLKRRERRSEADRTKVLLLTSQAPYR